MKFFELISSFFYTGFHFLIENRCLVCQQIDEDSICLSCKKYLTLNKYCCYQCARTLPKTTLCGQCLKQPNFFDITIAPYLYQKRVAELVKKAKYQRNLASQKALIDLMIDHLKKHYLKERMPEAIIYVPAHHLRLRIKGFNFAYLIAKDIHQNLKIPIFNLILKQKRTSFQNKLNRKSRLSNLMNAFDINTKVFQLFNQAGFERIALVDDVMTTGATANEIAKLVKAKTKVKQIDVWIIARGDD